jgi:hypothetical protein
VVEQICTERPIDNGYGEDFVDDELYLHRMECKHESSEDKEVFKSLNRLLGLLLFQYASSDM